MRNLKMQFCTIAFASKSLFNAEQQYSNIIQEALGILDGFEEFHHYCLAIEVHVITDEKPLVAMAMANKDVTTLSQQLQCIMLNIQQYSMCILYKPGPEWYIADWLFRNNHTENRDPEITGMNMNIHIISTTVHTPICTSIEGVRAAPDEDFDLQILKTYIIRGWPHTKDEAKLCIERYWPIRHELVMINGIAMKGKWIIIPYMLHKLIPQQLHSNHIGIEKVWLLVKESVYWTKMNMDIECTVKQIATYLEHQQTWPQQRGLHHELPCRPWKVVGAEIFMVNNKTLLYFVDYSECTAYNISIISTIYCRLLQQVPNYKKGEQSFNRWPGTNDQIDVCWIWLPRKLFQMQAKISCQRCSRNFAGGWSSSNL